MPKHTGTPWSELLEDDDLKPRVCRNPDCPRGGELFKPKVMWQRDCDEDCHQAVVALVRRLGRAQLRQRAVTASEAMACGN